MNRKKQKKPSEYFLKNIGRSKSEIILRKSEQLDRSVSERLRDHWLVVLLEIAGLLFIIPTAIVLAIDIVDRRTQREALRIDLEDRKSQRLAQAWAILAAKSSGNSGKGPALEFLNSKSISLTGIDLSTDILGAGTYLVGVDLPKSDLSYSDLSGAGLKNANLHQANLTGAKLEGALLLGTDLSRTDFTVSSLAGASLFNANLNDAWFYHSNLSGTTLMLSDMTGASFRNSDLSSAAYSLVDSGGVDVSGATLQNTPDPIFLRRILSYSPVERFGRMTGAYYMKGNPPIINSEYLVYFEEISKSKRDHWKQSSPCMWFEGMDYYECNSHAACSRYERALVGSGIWLKDIPCWKISDEAVG